MGIFREISMKIRIKTYFSATFHTNSHENPYIIYNFLVILLSWSNVCFQKIYIYDNL